MRRECPSSASTSTFSMTFWSSRKSIWPDCIMGQFRTEFIFNTQHPNLVILWIVLALFSYFFKPLFSLSNISGLWSSKLWLTHRPHLCTLSIWIVRLVIYPHTRSCWHSPRVTAANRRPWYLLPTQGERGHLFFCTLTNAYPWSAIPLSGILYFLFAGQIKRSGSRRCRLNSDGNMIHS